MSADLVVTAAQMREIEAQIFADGMPVAALMEKVGGLITAWLEAYFPAQGWPRVGVLVGPGHNGGDALVVARELSFRGYGVEVIDPCDRHKPLTAAHRRYAESLGIPLRPDLPGSGEPQPSFWVDGLFGFGLERSLAGPLAELVNRLNAQPQPIVSIDIPSGLHSDSGAVLGTAVRASHSLCLGLWKRAFCQDQALAYLGQPHRIDLQIPAAAIAAGLGAAPPVYRLSAAAARARLPLPRPAATHKYQVGHLLLVAGSRQYGGAALLAGLGARASGVGMVTLAVPESLRLMVLAQLPEALVVGCGETPAGAIAALPDHLDLGRYQAIAWGPGLFTDATALLQPLLASPTPLLIDADGLNLLAPLGAADHLARRSAPTLITPHPGEFRRLFPGLLSAALDPGQAAQLAAADSRAVVLLKGACTAIAHPDGRLWFNPDSTPALARGGSGDLLTGLAGGLLAQGIASLGNNLKTIQEVDPASALEVTLNAALAATWWHGTAARRLAQRRTVLGVDGLHLAAALGAWQLGEDQVTGLDGEDLGAGAPLVGEGPQMGGGD